MELNHTAQSPGRLSHILKAEMHISTGLTNRLKWQDRILVNGQSRHTDFAVQAGDTVTLLLDAPDPDYPAEDGPLTVLYEDDFLLAVDKPAGMLIHPSRAAVTGHFGQPGPGILCQNRPALRLPSRNPAGPGHLRHHAGGKKSPHPCTDE